MAASPNGNASEQNLPQAVQCLPQIIIKHVVLEEKAVTLLQREFEAAHKSFKGETSSWSASLETTCKTLCDKVANASTQQITVLQEAILAVYSLVHTAVRDVQAFLKEERGAAGDERSIN